MLGISYYSDFINIHQIIIIWVGEGAKSAFKVIDAPLANPDT